MTYQPMYPDPNQYPPTGQAPSEQSSLPRTSLILSLIALVLGLALTVVNVIAILKIFKETGKREFDSKTLPPELQPTANLFGMTLLGMIVPSIVGLVALVLGIISCSRPVRNKSLGVWAIVLSLVAPVICGVVWMVAGIAGAPQQ